MGIHFVVGKPGGGKGLFSLGMVVNELRFHTRPIVTNLAIKPADLAQYLHDTYGESFQLLQRLHIIPDADIRKFYLIRGVGLPLLPECKDAVTGKIESYDISAAQKGGGVFYLLDEVHLSFSARDWMAAGKSVLFYASQHRKLSDDVVLVTQDPKNVEKQFRSLAQDCSVIRNHAMEKVLFFKQPNVFTRQTFISCPPAPSEKPHEVSFFKLDVKLANCYETAAGVGIHNPGAKADIGQDKRKGIHWAWAFVFLAVLLAAMVMIPSLIGKGVAGAVSGASSSYKAAIPGGTNQVKAPAGSAPPAPGVPAPAPAGPVVTNAPGTNSVVGWSRLPGAGRRFFLADGDILSESAGDVTFIGPTHLETVDGRRIPLRVRLAD